MKPFTTHSGIAAPLFVDNVDTDQIIPSREMKRVSKLGLGVGLFAGSRYQDGDKTVENPEFVLNQGAFRDATILLSARNFGCGSSREHAVWALADFGFRAIIAESFGRIFRSNCARNGLLAVELGNEEIERIHEIAGESSVSIDLDKECILLPDGSTTSFSIDPSDRDMLLRGLDYIDFALQFSGDTDQFIEGDRVARPWAYLG